MNDLRQLEEEQERRNEKSRYAMRARLLASIMIPTWFPDYDPTIYHLDHKFSVSCGYENHIPLEIISAQHNLQLLSPEDNRRKGKKCSISIEELVEAYQPHPFVSEVVAMLKRMPLWKLEKASIHVSRRLRQLRKARQVSFGVSRPLPSP